MASAPYVQSICPRACAASTTTGTPAARASTTTSAAGCTVPRWLPTTVRCSRSIFSCRRNTSIPSTSARPSPSTGSHTGVNPKWFMIIRFGPNSPGRQATTRPASAGQACNSVRSASAAPVVNCT
ncbi:Uncharacterised protein [Mycobacteroides abscessus subsp. abscessus]|nr:Uncharacterised protein [Mycobacteroides abscessus subsp. abscessus]